MGSAASTKNGVRNNVKSLQAEMFAQFCELGQSCDQVGLSPQEIYRFLSERYLDYCESEDKSIYNFKDKPVPLPVRNITKAKTINASDLIKIILCSREYSEDAVRSFCNSKVPNRTSQTHLRYSSEKHALSFKKGQVSSLKSFQSSYNTNTVDGDVAEVAQKWKVDVTKTPNNLSYQDFTNSVCFIPNEVKVLFQGLKTFRSSSTSSVVVDLRVYFHTESQCIEIVPHIVQTVSAVGTGFRPITAPLSCPLSIKTDDFPPEDADCTTSDRQQQQQKQRQVQGQEQLQQERQQQLMNRTVGLSGWIKLDLFIDISNAPPAIETCDIDDAPLFIPLPRIYLDYNTLLGTVMEQPMRTDMLEHTVAATADYYTNIHPMCCAVDVCIDRMLVHFITSHLQMNKNSEEAAAVVAAISPKEFKTVDSFIDLACLAIRSPKGTADLPSPALLSSTKVLHPAASSTQTEDQRIRANLMDYTIRFDDSECGISPVFNAPKVLVPIPAVCADQIYIYCKGKQNNRYALSITPIVLSDLFIMILFSI